MLSSRSLAKRSDTKYAPFPRGFVARVSEPLIRLVAVWKQLHLNQRFANTPHKRTRNINLNDTLSYVAVWKEIHLS
jgi:hypothetical protein